MASKPPAIAVLGNVNLDIICKTVDDVPRQASIAFQYAAVTPGGCASNTAIGLAQQGKKVFLIACTGEDDTSDLLYRTWKKTGVDVRFVQRIGGITTGISVGLVDSDFQPRFIHNSGANGRLNTESINPKLLKEQNVEYLHIAGYFVLPGLLDIKFGEILRQAQDLGLFTSLDVVSSPAMESPEVLWPLLPNLDLFMSNLREAELITGHKDPQAAADFFHQQGTPGVIIKLGAEGCWFSNEDQGILLPAPMVGNVIDTTGAGDAFAAGLLAALQDGQDLPAACLAGNLLGAKNVEFLGAVNIS